MLLKLGSWGDLKAEAPQSLATCFEFVSLWAGEEDHATIGRLCAGALGLYLDAHKRLPKYRPLKQKPLEYGYLCLNRLLENGIPPNSIFEAGSLCLIDMAAKIPTEKEVEERENFSASHQGEI